MRRIFSHILMLIAVVCITTACCIREDLSECNSNLALRFRYTLNTQNQNLFENQISQVVVYVFDSNNKYVGSYESPKNMSNQDLMRIELPEGKYNAIVLGGNYNTYKVGELDNVSNSIAGDLVVGKTDINNFRLELLNASASDGYLHPTSTPDTIFMGSVYSIAAIPNNENIVDVDLIKLTKNIIVNVINSTSLAPTKAYEYDDDIKCQNARFDQMSNTDKSISVIKYTPIEYTQSSNTLTMRHKVMRLMMDDTQTLEVVNTASQQIVYSKNIIELLTATNKYKTQQDIDREDTYVFDIILYDNVLVSVIVNGWVVVDIEPEL